MGKWYIMSMAVCMLLFSMGRSYASDDQLSTHVLLKANGILDSLLNRMDDIIKAMKLNSKSAIKIVDQVSLVLKFNHTCERMGDILGSHNNVKGLLDTNSRCANTFSCINGRLNQQMTNDLAKKLLTKNDATIFTGYMTRIARLIKMTIKYVATDVRLCLLVESLATGQCPIADISKQDLLTLVRDSVGSIQPTVLSNQVDLINVNIQLANKLSRIESFRRSAVLMNDNKKGDV